MISHASELLSLFIDAEKEKLKGVNMPHMPTLGSAYEEITKQGIDQAFVIPKSLDLRVVAGFIEISGAMLPEQIDCLLVEGEGRRFGIGIHQLSRSDGILFYTLVQEQHAPVSIVHGYEGYKTESGLRNTFMDIIEERSKLGGPGLGIPSFPTLVTSNNFCLVKGNGLPYLAIKDEKSWVAIFSTRHNPARIILELIWSKISRYCSVKMPWGIDLDIENIAPLLIAEPIEYGGHAGWWYKSIEPKERRLTRDENSLWEPARVGAAETAAINIMAMNGGYLQLDAGLKNYLEKTHNCTLDLVVKNLIQSRAFAQDGDYLRPLASMTHVLINDDESGYIALERDRFDSWCQQNGRQPAYLTIVLLSDD